MRNSIVIVSHIINDDILYRDNFLFSSYFKSSDATLNLSSGDFTYTDLISENSAVRLYNGSSSYKMRYILVLKWKHIAYAQ